MSEAIEFSVVLALRALSISEYLAERAPVAGVVYVVMLIVFSAMPFLVGRVRGPANVRGDQ